MCINFNFGNLRPNGFQYQTQTSLKWENLTLRRQGHEQQKDENLKFRNSSLQHKHTEQEHKYQN